MRLKKGTSLLQRKAGEVKRYRQEKKIVPIIMGCIALLTVIVYVISLLYTRFGSFTVSVNKFHNLDYGLSLCERSDFANPTARLDCKDSKEITNIDGRLLDTVPLGSVDGAQNGENYICYTFYCKNTGKETLSYSFSMNIVNMTLEIEKAVRVRYITSLNNGKAVSTDYAKAKSVDENLNPVPETYPRECKPFLEERMICYEVQKDFKPGDVMKQTVAIWLEGNDEDCVDKIIGGVFKIDMKFEVTSVAGEATK
ncbi:MAG: hypothetical protein KBS97_00310 [Firmicutes bacterium]|nr:hypothetical protein [Candidatus Fiminaster equi]